ncbi:chaperonin 10-like protein [Emericellopsis atlantica]|uniref:Chaperonin 10-like protein n=1 Tax=Emericellopsis atlantica TaxID=2614577 RepID=A0A9P7ZG88_9HYPO|nr:chaperonin 10-like protein [Emericellopsis atlantica]KAG9251015.1 chaperonin 10-like protein [Emericellopsis atlantica]
MSEKPPAMAAQNTKFLIRALGGPLEAATAPLPRLTSPTQVLINIRAVGLNPADHKMITAGHRVASYPMTPGLDGSGVVQQVGDEVENVQVGDEVMGCFVTGDVGASFQAYAFVDSWRVGRKPVALSFEEAASLGVSYMTAVMGLSIGLTAPVPFLHHGPTGILRSGSVLVLGGSSALGAASIQLLKLSLPECRILTTVSPRHKPLVEGLGVDAVINRSSTTIAQDVKSATEGRGVDAILDAVGAGASQRDIFDAFNLNGPRRYAQVWTGDEEIGVPDGVNSITFRSRDVGTLQGGHSIMSALERLLEEGRYKLPLPVRVVGKGLEGIEAGIELIGKGVSGEKLVVTL